MRATKHMKKILLFSAIIFVGLVSCGALYYWISTDTDAIDGAFQQSQQDDLGESGLPDPSTVSRPERLQIGANFIRFFFDEDPKKETFYYQPDWIFNDFSKLGVQGYRQFVKADLFWDVVEPKNDEWFFENADEVIPRSGFEPIVTLFAMQYASATPPWVTDSSKFEKTLGVEAKEYLDKVIERYGSYVKYWEIGNEMDHWRLADVEQSETTAEMVKDGDLVLAAEEKIPVSPLDGFSPEEQGKFFAEVAAYIRARDADAVIVMPGMSAPIDYSIDTWLPGVLAGAGKNTFDIVNYHYYSSYERFMIVRSEFGEKLQTLGIGDKPVWLTETGSSSDVTLTIRTNYPNSVTSQAADIFRRIIPAYASGDSYVNWHTFLESVDEGGEGSWRAYGLRTSTGKVRPSYAAFQLLTSELIPFSTVETLASDPRKVMAFKMTTDAGDEKYVAWGTGTFKIPVGVSEYTSVIPSSNGEYIWEAIESGESFELSENPVLLK